MKYLACALVLAACGGKSPTPASPNGADHANAALPDVPWAQLDHEQREQFMAEKVMPAMEPLFKKHDPAKFAQFGCETCHGKDGEDKHHKMPNDGLPHLSHDMSKFKPEDLAWMKNDIMPAMAATLKLKEWAPDNQTGFGCAGCHVFEQ